MVHIRDGALRIGEARIDSLGETLKWYGPEIEKIRTRLRAKPYQADLA